MSATVNDDRGWRGVVDHDPPRTLFDAAEEARTLADDTIESRFQAFHAAHPGVYKKLREFSFELIAAGWDHFGISVVWERVRYESMLGHRPDEQQPWRLNDNFRSRYARLLIDQEPALAEVFRVRQLRSASRPPGVCGSCAAGRCSHCISAACTHACDLEAIL